MPPLSNGESTRRTANRPTSNGVPAHEPSWSSGEINLEHLRLFRPPLVATLNRLLAKLRADGVDGPVDRVLPVALAAVEEIALNDGVANQIGGANSQEANRQ